MGILGFQPAPLSSIISSAQVMATVLLPFPLDIEESIIDQLPELNRQALLSSALVCKRWRPRCYYHLFRVVRIHSKAQLGKLNTTLSSNNKLGAIVEVMALQPPTDTLRWTINPEVADFISLALVLLLPQLPNLSSISMVSINWNEIQRCAKACIRTYAHTVRELRISSIAFATLGRLLDVMTSIRSLRSLRILHCSSVNVQQRVQYSTVLSLKLMTSSLPLSSLYVEDINMAGEMVKILLHLSRFTLETLGLHVSHERKHELQPSLSDMQRLRSLKVNMTSQLGQFGTQEVEVIRNLLATIPHGTLASLEISFLGFLSSTPTYGSDPVTETLRALENDLLGKRFSGLRSVTFMLPLAERRSGTSNLWMKLFEKGFPELERRGMIKRVNPPMQSTYQAIWHPFRVERIAFSPDNCWMAITFEALSTTVVIWDVAAREAICKWSTHRPNPSSNLAFSPDGRLLAVLGVDDIGLFSVPFGQEFTLLGNFLPLFVPPSIASSNGLPTVPPLLLAPPLETSKSGIPTCIIIEYSKVTAAQSPPSCSPQMGAEW
ncbi:hypothetical protein L227DRAFT_651166 [Lentinus tigrinus ALCF2SS1-6]|uniref:F-box domain-containing protein n=1 Tax=Lentinus tigrinus ALCF2SS1-6 TaxID=1328759 RepID=A0A5C2SJY0_9APHY|nr:hypothetical protein L227DRAFT_651166 [Lentinus tigrinus ALCF2SS1-6]